VRAGCARATQLPKWAPRGLGPGDNRDQLKIGLAEWHDSVGRAPARVTATLDRSQAVARFDFARGICQVGHGNQYVIELQDLLRHRLLPQSGGFEGFAPGPEDLYGRNLGTAEGVDVKVVALDRGAARSATSLSAVSGQDPRLGVEELKQVGVLVIERLLGGGEVSPDLLDPMMDGRTGEFALIMPFDIWIEELAREISQLALRTAPLRCLSLRSGSPVPECGSAAEPTPRSPATSPTPTPGRL
jgi:hypothetical protein